MNEHMGGGRSAGSSAIETLTILGSRAANTISDGATYAAENYDKLPDIANKQYRKAQSGVRNVYHNAKNVTQKTLTNPASLSFTELVVVATLTIVTTMVVLQQVLSYYNNHLPELMSGVIKGMVYFVIPSVAIAGVYFGMYLEQRYAMFADVQLRIDQTVQFIRDVIKRLADIFSGAVNRQR